MKLRILSAGDVRAALPMPAAIAAVKTAFGQFSAGTATVPLRSRMHTDKGVVLLMPAFMQASRDMAVKVVSVFGDNPSLGLPTVSALVMVLDAETGQPRAIMDGDSLTALRTGAAGGLAAELLAVPDARQVALFGAGVQARSQLQAAMAVRPIDHVTIVDPFAASAQRLADEIATWEKAPQVIIGDDAQAAIADADIVLAATTTKTPLFDGSGLKPGAHVTGVGAFTPEMQEIDPATIARALVVVDSRQACLAEAGDIIAAKAEIDAELGEIVNGTHPGRQSADQVTCFKSVGLAAQDAAAAAAALKAAEQRDLGVIVDMG